MIKRIIFDVDNTLIEWKEEYYKTIIRVLENMNYPCDDALARRIDSTIASYEKYYDRHDVKLMSDLINQQTNLKLPPNFLLTLLNEQCNDTDKDEEVIEVLEYLASKYEIVALTNWFTDGQSKRLEAAGLLKYITKVYGADTFLNKPSEEGFIKAMSPYQPSECMMIGDSIRCDIEPAHKLGIPIIYYDYKNKKDGNDYPTINKFKQLKDIL